MPLEVKCGWEFNSFLVMNIKNVLLQLIDERFMLHHRSNWNRPVSKDDKVDATVESEKTRLVSSANNLEVIFFKKKGKSLIKIKKNKGPKIEPCGTPNFISLKDDLELPNNVNWFRFVK